MAFFSYAKLKTIFASSFLSRSLVLKSKTLFHCVFIGILIASVYYPVADYKFQIGWDDQWFVTNYMTSGGFTLANFRKIFFEYYYGQYAPINQLYYAILYRFFGYSSISFHITGIIIHFFNSLLVYRLLDELLNINPETYSKHNKNVAFLSALIFSIISINVESVAWVAASKVLIYSFFYLLGLLFYLRYLKSNKRRYFYLTIIVFIISFGAKEQAVTLPLTLFLFDYWYDRKFSNFSLWLEKMPFILLSILFGLITLDSQQIESSDFYTLFERIPLFFYTTAEYFTKILIPVNLSYLYPFPFLKNQPIPSWLWIYPISVPTILICFWVKIKKKAVLFPILFFGIHILLVCNIVSLARYSITADRYAYLASIGIIVLLVNFSISKSISGKNSLVRSSVFVLYIICLACYSHNHVDVWKDATALKYKLKSTIKLRIKTNQIK